MRRGTVFIDRLRLYAYHGVMEQERTVGAWFIVSLWVDCDMEAAVENDDLSGTIDYAELCDIVRSEMATPSRLLEHAAARIARHILTSFPSVLQVRIRLTKENPPLGANVQGAGVELVFEVKS